MVLTVTMGMGQQLRDLDNHRPEGAWKAEDPNVWAPPNGKTDPVYDILQKWRKEEENRNGLLTATSLNHMISSHQKMGKLWSNKDMLTSYSGLTCYNSFPKMESTWESKLRGDPDHEQVCPVYLPSRNIENHALIIGYG